ncbi:hypothetical protein C3F09_00055 [candidate division GN15 bacterium]|uniref:Outer membrane protein beta-barrel domain-containing protein n=1 Tax=candidate division GN15 bacterium TaxID=2072418 RepID=A0A855X4M7_9BACT|nr:MAG: hypothetical protein C3F09_00055 [candidate division GN15 bacterium]
MKTKLALVVALALGLAGPTYADFPAFGSAFGCLTTASAIGQGRGMLGGGVGIADATSAFGTFTYGLSKFTDGRLRFGFIDYDEARVAFGADFKWQFWQVGQGRREPMDMAVGGFFEYEDVYGGSIFQFGGQLFGSYPINLNRGGTLSPYGRFNIRMETLSGTYGGSNTELKFGFNGGVEWKATRDVAFYGEFQFDGNDGLFLGINFNVM